MRMCKHCKKPLSQAGKEMNFAAHSVKISLMSTKQDKRKRGTIKNAKYGWYKYDVRFALPVYEENVLVRYNIFHARLLINHAENGRKYLYDILAIKKKRASRSKMYGENPFLNANNTLFFQSCQSPILIFFRILPLAFLMQWGNFRTRADSITGNREE